MRVEEIETSGLSRPPKRCTVQMFAPPDEPGPPPVAAPLSALSASISNLSTTLWSTALTKHTDNKS